MNGNDPRYQTPKYLARLKSAHEAGRRSDYDELDRITKRSPRVVGAEEKAWYEGFGQVSQPQTPVELSRLDLY